MKIVINSCFGGFSLSDKAKKELGVELETKVNRADPQLVAIVERDGNRAAREGSCTDLCIVEVPDDATDWMIINRDGDEDVIYVQEGRLRYAF